MDTKLRQVLEMSTINREKRHAIVTVAVLLMSTSISHAFVSSRQKPVGHVTQRHRFGLTWFDLLQSGRNFYSTYRRNTIVKFVTSSSDAELEAEINSLRAKEIRDELESYGIDTKVFLEKKELVQALLAARKEGKTPINDMNGASASPSGSSAGADTSSSGSNTANREERLQEETEKCKSMKVGDLKKELESYGVSTKSYFEKSEFVRAVAEARVDGVKKQSARSSVGGSTSGGQQKEEPRDPSFRDVAVSKFSGNSKAALGGQVIDVKAR